MSMLPIAPPGELVSCVVCVGYLCVVYVLGVVCMYTRVCILCMYTCVYVCVCVCVDHKVSFCPHIPAEMCCNWVLAYTHSVHSLTKVL